MRQTKIAFAAVISGVLLALAAVLLPIPLPVRFLLVLLAALSSAAGAVLYYPLLLEKVTLPPKVEQLVETLTGDLEDDLEDLKEAKLTPPLAYAGVTTLASVLFCYLLLFYRKLGATWLGVPVLVFSAVAVFIAADRMGRSRWFQDRRVRTPQLAVLIPLAGIVIATGLGIYMTEPLEYGGSTAYQRSAAGGDQDFPSGSSNTRAHWFFLDLFSDGAMSGSFDLDFGGDEGVMLLLIIVLVVVAIALILGSTMIPHFWVLAGFVLLTCMGMIALRELRVRPEPPLPPIRDDPPDEAP